MSRGRETALDHGNRSPRTAVLLAIGILALLGAAIRARAALDELWLDEIWSIQSVLRLRSPLEILTRWTIDNNHPLNSAFIWAIGEVRSFRLYRLPALLAGAGTLLLAAAAEWPDRQRAVVAELLTSASALLVVYSSEARGYAPAVFFAMAALVLCERYWRTPGRSLGILFGICVVLGFLSHLTYVYVFAALLILSFHLCRQRGSAFACGAHVARLFAPPAAAVAILYGPFLTHLVYGGGPREPLGQVLAQLLESLATGSEVGKGVAPVALAVAAALAFELLLEWREGDPRWPFSAAILVAPLAVVLVLRPPLLYPRYFLVCVPFLLLLLSRLFVRLWRRGTAGRTLFACALFFLMLGNAGAVARLLTLGRGHYLEGVLYMARHTRGSIVTVTSDHDFRNGMLLSFYEKYAPRGTRFVYVPFGAPGVRAEWLIRHSRNAEANMPERIRLRAGGVYVLAMICPFWGGLSGFSWFVYRRAPERRPFTSSGVTPQGRRPREAEAPLCRAESGWSGLSARSSRAESSQSGP